MYMCVYVYICMYLSLSLSLSLSLYIYIIYIYTHIVSFDDAANSVGHRVLFRPVPLAAPH